jgi:flagellar assembly factor FliW
MKLDTLRFGEIEIEDDKILRFPQGIPGFEQTHEFVLVHADEGIPFSFMQAVAEGGLSFIVTDPFLFFPDYEFELSDSVKKELHIGNESDVMVRCVASIHDKNVITLNLLAPIVLNVVERAGKQVILHSSTYKTKHVLSFEVLNKTKEQSLKEV